MITNYDQLLDALGIDTVLFLDFETFYAKDKKVLRENNKGKQTQQQFRLSPKMPIWEYAFHDLFHYTNVAYGFDGQPLIRPESKQHVKSTILNMVKQIKLLQQQGKKVGVCAHNTSFDAGLLAWHYQIEFDAYIDTMLIETLQYTHASVSLANTCKRRGLPIKTDELALADGIMLVDFTDELFESQCDYCVNDTSIMRELLHKQLEQGVPEEELKLMHVTLRGACVPQFKTRTPLLMEALEQANQTKNDAILDSARYLKEHGIIEASPQTYSSRDKYAGLLQKLDIDVPTKLNAKGEPTWAFAQGDVEYVRMMLKHPEHEPVYTARRLSASNIEATRAVRLKKASDNFRFNSTFDADLPMFLNYYGASNTGRWSGGALLNQQNLKRGSKHRLAHEAPDGYVIGVNDLSQIELRMNLWFCEQDDLLDNYRIDPDYDVYSILASSIYNKEVSKGMPERMIGKAGMLGLQFAMSWYRFQQYLASGPLGMDPTFISDTEAKRAKQAYELSNFKVVMMWKLIQGVVLPILANGGSLSFGRHECVTVEKDQIILPSGRILRYPNTREEYEGEEHSSFRVKYVCDGATNGDHVQKRYLWHGLIIENIVQSLARDVIGFHIVHTDRQLINNGYGHVIGSVHDEILALIDEYYADTGFEIMQKVMQVQPDWCHDLPLASEGGYAKNYSK